MNIVLATGNPHKAEELQQMLGASVVPAPPGFDVEETGTTLLQNALLKAHALRGDVDPRHLVLADDSGLAVHALDGRPGVYSARYAGPDATYADNNRLLLTELDGVDDRRAAFVCVLVALDGAGGVRMGCGVCPGTIAHELRGDGGFGYDPVFLVAGDHRSMAELSPLEKNAVSHRGRAARMLSAALEAAA
ncbi:MAG: RdgB/HAM1 family non-canonical purine NTP pyrophosphatase [Thermoleophilia bacterium]